MDRPEPSFRVRNLGLAATLVAALALIAATPAAGRAGASSGDAPASIPPWFPSGPPSPELLALLPQDVQVDNFGNAWVTRGSGSPHLLVLAHRDAPGWIVSEITRDGYLRVQRLGTPLSQLAEQFLVGKRLVVYTRRGPLPAVATAPSIHFRRVATLPVPEATVDDLWIDVGAESDREAREMGIALLDPVVPGAAGAPHGEYGAGARAACERVADLARSGLAREGTVTYAWVAGGTEGARGSLRLRNTLGPVDSVVVIEALPFAEADSAAWAAVVQGGVGVGPADTAAAASAAWAARLRAAHPELARGPAAPRVADARVWSAAGIPTVVCTIPLANAGSPGEMVGPASGMEAVLGPPGDRGAIAVRPSAGVASTAGPWGPHATAGALHAEAWGAIAPILAAYGVSEHEGRVAEAVRAQLPPDAARAASVDARGNLILRLGDGPPGRLFVAHMDEIGYRVTKVDGDGRGRVERKGGFFDWLYEGESVRVAGPGSAVTDAIVAPRTNALAVPRPPIPQPLTNEVRSPIPPDSRFGVADVRVEPAGNAPTPLAPGADITVFHDMARLGEHRFAARAIDDRLGDAALVLAARELWPERHHLPNAVWLVWSVEEETGLKGATWLADSLAHHGALPVRVHAVDTFVANDSPLEDPRFGGARLGQGAVIRAADTSHEAPLDAVYATLRLAHARDIPLQYGVTAGGNDGVPFAEHGSINVPLGWPLRSSHSAVEVADLRDLESLARMVTALAEQPARDDPKSP